MSLMDFSNRIHDSRSSAYNTFPGTRNHTEDARASEAFAHQIIGPIRDRSYRLKT